MNNIVLGVPPLPWEYYIWYIYTLPPPNIEEEILVFDA